MPETVLIIGGSGAPGFGLAVRPGRAGVTVVLGLRDAHRAEKAADRATQVGIRITGLPERP